MNAPLRSHAFINPFAQPAVPTLADVAQNIAASTLKPTRKRDYLSALRRVGDLLDQPLSDLPADPKILRERLEAVMDLV